MDGRLSRVLQLRFYRPAFQRLLALTRRPSPKGPRLQEPLLEQQPSLGAAFTARALGSLALQGTVWGARLGARRALRLPAPEEVGSKAIAVWLAYGGCRGRCVAFGAAAWSGRLDLCIPCESYRK